MPHAKLGVRALVRLGALAEHLLELGIDVLVADRPRRHDPRVELALRERKHQRDRQRRDQAQGALTTARHGAP